MREDLEESFRLVEQTILTCCSDLPKEAFTPQLEGFLPFIPKDRNPREQPG